MILILIVNDDEVGQGCCGARNGWLRIQHATCFFNDYNFTSYRANGFTHIPKEITNDKSLARSLSSSVMLQSIQFTLVRFLSHPHMEETIFSVEVVVCLEHDLDKL